MAKSNTSGKITVLIADDHTIVRVGLAALLGTKPDIEVVGQAVNGLEAVAKSIRLKPDVVIMDLMMPQMDGVSATIALAEKAPKTKVILLTTFGTSDGIAHALESGAKGAILKSADNIQLVTAIRTVAAGGEYISEEVSQQLAIDPPIPELTPRQAEVLSSMIRGLTDRDIARQLAISHDRVTQHVCAILQKLNAANRTEAVGIALRKHLLKL